ncbi:sortase domain-containing protein [Pseudolactococcus yaeyamensis]
MKKRKSFKLLTIAMTLLASIVVSTQTLAREKGDSKKDKETRKIDIDLRFNQRFTEEKKAVETTTTDKTAPKLVEPDVQATPAPTPAPTPDPEPTPPAPTPAPDPAPAPAPVTTNALSMIGTVIPFQNGGMGSGQAIIDANPNGTASTWGGATPYSGTDGLNTHFIGHHWGAFDPVLSLGNGGTVTIYDENGQAFNYAIYKIVVVDTYGNDVSTGASMYGEITSTGGGERIVLQTCIDETTRRIVFAS